MKKWGKYALSEVKHQLLSMGLSSILNGCFFNLFFLLLSLDLTPTLLCIGSGRPLPSLVFFIFFLFFLIYAVSFLPFSPPQLLYAILTSPASFLPCFTDKASPILLGPTQSSGVALPGGPWPCTGASRWCALLLLDRPSLFFKVEFSRPVARPDFSVELLHSSRLAFSLFAHVLDSTQYRSLHDLDQCCHLGQYFFLIFS